MQDLQSPILFIVNRSDLEGRFEPEYYRPSIRKIEDRIRSKAHKKLRDFIKKISSGATPSVQEEEKYYSDKENGVPFLRVQNLQTNSQLNLEDVKYINRVTHEKYLKRSQVKGGDLLVKITGVGRMAIASVAPEGFEGNTNQHMVVIKTGDRSVSEYLAFYLNLDIVEKISSRRSTGGTRPALDYPALKSIPIVENIDFNAIRQAEAIKAEKLGQVALLSASIDALLLEKLSIFVPSPNRSDVNKSFITSFSDLTGSRFDPKLYEQSTRDLKAAIKSSPFPKEPLKNLIIHSVAGDWGLEDNDEAHEGYQRCLVIRATEFDNDGNLDLDNSRVKHRLISKYKLKRMNIKANDLLIEKSGGSPDQPVGRIALITEDMLSQHNLCYSNFIHKIRVDESKVLPEYLFYFLKAMHNIKLTDAMQSQTNGIRNLIMSNYFNQDIVLPDPSVQGEIVTKIRSIRTEIDELNGEAEEVLLNAKRTVEQLILG
jgi:hypothetical protein